MARFYPTIDDDFHGSDGEIQVYQALQQLSDGYVVFHSFRWLGESGQYRSEGEGDFIIFHPTKGILSIEVKSGGIGYEEGSWIQINRRNNSKKRINPLGQAAETQYRIQRILRQHFPYDCPMIGRAAWFTSVAMDSKLRLPAEAVPEIILDQLSLAHPEEALDKVYAYWKDHLGRSFTPLKPPEFKALIQTLMPSFRIAETISSSSRETKTSYVQLTNQQFSILRFLQEQRTAAIYGPAGTGKTMLAVEKARMLASQGKKVLYLCFNEFLLQYLRRHYHDPQITFHNVRTLAEEILQDDTLPLNKVVAVFEQYFESEFNDDDWAYPNIVVDEGQDLSDSILEHLSFLAELQDGCFYIFYDRNQYIMSRKTTGWIDKNAECRLVLYKNCRNTAEIATSIGKLMHMKDSYVNTIQGMTPKAVFYGNEKELQKQADHFVKDMCQQGVALKDMVILTAHSVGHSGLKGCRTLNGIPVTTEPEDGKILFTSVRKFKGLEATAVLLIDVNLSELPDDLMQRLIYVGSSRATMYLKIAFCEDIAKKNYGPILDALTDEPVKHNRSGLVKTLHLEAD